MKNFPLPRIDNDVRLRELLIPYSRFKPGDVWSDPRGKHKIACLDATDGIILEKLTGDKRASLAIQDPPYNFVAFEEKDLSNFIEWCRKWVSITNRCLSGDSSFYIWLGADQNNHFQPFADFIVMMRDFEFNSRSLITMRNQRGYGTQKNWMSIRQELLYYIKGKPVFNIEAEYTDIPKILNGYYKTINGQKTKNFERSKSEFIRAGNVWVDIQQVFYRMEENVNGCYAQKPLKAIDRIMLSSSAKNDVVVDFFAHSGATLLSAERYGRRCLTSDIDPVFCEIVLRRLENYRTTGKLGWQNSNPFEEEITNDQKLKNYLSETCEIEITAKDEQSDSEQLKLIMH
jgi:site-specific DNA-methyltransferase (adenine-specific)